MYSKLVNHLNPLVSHPKLDFINPHELVNIGYQLSPSKTAEIAGGGWRDGRGEGTGRGQRQ
jgi:hypothetical protein